MSQPSETAVREWINESLVVREDLTPQWPSGQISKAAAYQAQNLLERGETLMFQFLGLSSEDVEHFADSPEGDDFIAGSDPYTEHSEF